MAANAPYQRGAERRHAGFSLIELLIVVVLIAILAAIIAPTYQNSVLKSRRADAATLLSSVAQKLERCNAECNAYTCTFGAICPLSLPQPSPEGQYTITAANGTVIAADSSTLVATPVPGESQTRDHDCTSFSLTDTGVRNATGNAPSTCWQ